jgi:outer membrane lipoprotein-sorting protein
MRSLILLLIPLTIFGKITAQEDPEALKILDRFASIAVSSPSVSFSFTMFTNDVMENRKDTLEGKVVIAGDKYRLSLPESTTWFNGTDNWNYMPSVEEVTITRPDSREVSFFAKPSLLFEMYKQDYKARLIEETSATWVIDLYPNDIKSEMTRVRLTISKTGTELKNAEYKTRNGITITLNVRDYNLKFRPDGKYFDFNPADYKGVEVIDMR